MTIYRYLGGEDAGDATINWYRLGDPQDEEGGEAFTSNITWKSGTAINGQDFLAFPQTLNFLEDDYGVPHPIALSILEDDIVEPTEVFYMYDEDPAGLDTAEIYIEDNDSTVVSLVSNASIKEDRLFATVTVTLTNPVSVPLTLTYSIVSGTATAGFDIQNIQGGTIVIPAMSKTATIQVALIDDRVYEGPESFSVVIDSLQAEGIRPDQLIAGSSASVLIEDDEKLIKGNIDFNGDGRKEKFEGSLSDLAAKRSTTEVLLEGRMGELKVAREAADAQFNALVATELMYIVQLTDSVGSLLVDVLKLQLGKKAFSEVADFLSDLASFAADFYTLRTTPTNAPIQDKLGAFAEFLVKQSDFLLNEAHKLIKVLPGVADVLEIIEATKNHRELSAEFQSAADTYEAKITVLEAQINNLQKALVDIDDLASTSGVSTAQSLVQVSFEDVLPDNHQNSFTSDADEGFPTLLTPELSWYNPSQIDYFF